MSKKPLEAALQDQLNKLASLPDDQIDTVDTHETSPEAWLHARRPGLYKPVKKPVTLRSEEHTSELQSLMRISYAVFCLKKKKILTIITSSHCSQYTNNNHLHKNFTKQNNKHLQYN